MSRRLWRMVGDWLVGHRAILFASNVSEWEYTSGSDRISRMARTKSSKPARVEPASGEELPNPVWFKPVMFGFMLLGLAWIIVFYVSQGRLPIADLGSWNILIGFGIAFVGFLMTTRWR
jgi:Cell division protein CrgA